MYLAILICTNNLLVLNKIIVNTYLEQIALVIFLDILLHFSNKSPFVSQFIKLYDYRK